MLFSLNTLPQLSNTYFVAARDFHIITLTVEKRGCTGTRKDQEPLLSLLRYNTGTSCITKSNNIMADDAEF